MKFGKINQKIHGIIFEQDNDQEKPFYKISVVDPPKKSLYFDGIKDSMELNVTVDLEAGKPHVFSIFTVLSTDDIANERIVVGNGSNYGDKYYGFGWKGGKFCIWKGDTYIEIQNDIYPLKASAIELNKKMCKSVEWDLTLPTVNHSRLWINGKQVHNFTSVNKTSSRNSKLYLGHRVSRLSSFNSSLNKLFKGELWFFGLLKNRKIKEKEIKLQHYLLCNRYKIDFDDSAFNVI